MANLAAGDPSRSLDRRSLIRAELIAGNRADGRQGTDFGTAGLKETKCNNPEDILITARIGETRVSCFLSLEMKQPEPEMDLVRLKIVGMDDIDQSHNRDDNEEDSDDDIEIDDGEEKTALNAQREAVLETLLDEFELIDEKKLCFLPNKLVFRLNISFHILQDNGCVLDTAVFSLMAALQRLRFPKVKYIEEEDLVDFDWDNLHLPEVPVTPELTSSFAVVGSTILASPTAEEESVADAIVLCVATDDGRIAFAQVIDGTLSSSEIPFSDKPLPHMLDLAVHRRKELKQILSQPFIDDVLIPEDRVRRLTSFNLAG